jgi:hypothetical protein
MVDYCGNTLLDNALAILNEGKGDTFTSKDRTIIVKTLAICKKSNEHEALCAEVFPLMKPFLSESEIEEVDKVEAEAPKAKKAKK